MKFFIIIAILLTEQITYAGGGIGGGTPPAMEADKLLQEFLKPGFNLEQLPKVFIDPAVFRRVNARLSVDGSIETFVGGESLTLKKFQNMITDDQFSKLVLPSE